MSQENPIPPGAVVTELVFSQSRFAMWLLPEKAVFIPLLNALLVADVHIGKAATFRSLGVAVPAGTTNENLVRLSHLIELTKAQHVYILGDLFHGPEANQVTILHAIKIWRASVAAVNVVLIDGNHDARAKVVCSELNIQTAIAPLTLRLDDQCSLALHHEPVNRKLISENVVAIAGHWHPAFRLRGNADTVRLPCFWFNAQQWILPAFGEFTGGHPINPALGNKVFVTDGAQVHDVTGLIPRQF